MRSSEICELDWRKSSLCRNGECVEVAAQDGMVLLRSSSDAGEVLSLTPDEWEALVHGMRAGEFEHLTQSRRASVPYEAGRGRHIRQTAGRDPQTNPDRPSAKTEPQSAQQTIEMRWLPSQRQNTGPVSCWDYSDRRETRAIFSQDVQELQVAYDKHMDGLEWQKVYRVLALTAGLMSMGLAFAAMLKVLGFTPDLAAGVTFSGLVSAVSGSAVWFLRARFGASVLARHNRHDADGQSDIADRNEA
jgi:hypothetical protein